MLEPANGEPLTVQGALTTITRLEKFEVGLFHRTEGIMWMFWGLVTSGIFFSYATIGQAFDEFPFWGALLWVPWVAAGVTATYSLWRSAHLTTPSETGRKEGIRQMWISGAIFMGIIMVGGFVYGEYQAGIDFLEPGYFQLLLGVCSFGMAFFTRSSPAARRMLMLVGASSILVALVMGLVLEYPSVGIAYMMQTVAGVATVGAGWFLGGLYLTVKG